MDTLWAPWRIGYIHPAKGKKKIRQCIFCAAKRGKNKKDYVIFKTKHAISMLNIFPYNNGHVMVCPSRHVCDIRQLKSDEILGLFSALSAAISLLDKVLKPEGYNIGMNTSKCSGAGIPEHLHIHIVPRWTGDTNFMTTVCSTKIISQSLDALYRQLLRSIKDAKPKRH